MTCWISENGEHLRILEPTQDHLEYIPKNSKYVVWQYVEWLDTWRFDAVKSADNEFLEGYTQI